jgi:hypothetical protein
MSKYDYVVVYPKYDLSKLGVNIKGSVLTGVDMNIVVLLEVMKSKSKDCSALFVKERVILTLPKWVLGKVLLHELDTSLL